MSSSGLNDPKLRYFFIFITSSAACAIATNLVLGYFLSPPPVAHSEALHSERPRLTVDGRRELQSYLQKENLKLGSYGWIDRKNQVARIPIERAMEMIITERSAQ